MVVMLTLSVPVITGCAGLKAGIQTARVTVNKGFDFADRAVDTIDKVTGTAVTGAVATVQPVTSSSP